MKGDLRVRLTAEFLGTAFLVAAVIGSGIMGERLAGGNVAIASLANTDQMGDDRAKNPTRALGGDNRKGLLTSEYRARSHQPESQLD